MRTFMSDFDKKIAVRLHKNVLEKRESDTVNFE